MRTAYAPSTSAMGRENAVGAASRAALDWHQIDWSKAQRPVRRLQARIVQATQEGRWGKVTALQHLLTHSPQRQGCGRAASDGEPRQTHTRRGPGYLEHTGEEDTGRAYPAAAWLPTTTCPPGVHPEKQRQDTPAWDPDHAGPCNADALSARTHPCGRNPSGPELLRVSGWALHG